MPISKAIIFSIGGIIAIVLGGQVVVNAATGIAKSFGVSDQTMPISKAIIFSIGGIIAIVLGGQVVVNAATGIAKSFGVSDQLIGLTIVAIGTSLPELVTSIIAATKGESDIALGNVIVANIFNILFVLCASAAISPIAIDPKMFEEALYMLGVTVLTSTFTVVRKDIYRAEGALFTDLSVGFTAYLIMSI